MSTCFFKGGGGVELYVFFNLKWFLLLLLRYLWRWLYLFNKAIYYNIKPAFSFPLYFFSFSAYCLKTLDSDWSRAARTNMKPIWSQVFWTVTVVSLGKFFVQTRFRKKENAFGFIQHWKQRLIFVQKNDLSFDINSGFLKWVRLDY